MLLSLVSWERGHPGRFRSRRDACAPRKNHTRISVQILNYASAPFRPCSGASALQPLLQLRPAHRVHDVPALEPAASRLVDTGAHEAQMLDAMRVAINDELYAEFARPLHVHIVEVKPLWL